MALYLKRKLFVLVLSRHVRMFEVLSMGNIMERRRRTEEETFCIWSISVEEAVGWIFGIA
jgi:hypothetical protein